MSLSVTSRTFNRTKSCFSGASRATHPLPLKNTTTASLPILASRSFSAQQVLLAIKPKPPLFLWRHKWIKGVRTLVLPRQMELMPIKRKPRPGVVEPCAESGGVPEPTSEYLQQAAGESRRLQIAQPLLIVSDLNGTMLHRPDSFFHPKAFVQRPFAALFLDYMIKNLWFVFWSSAQPENVRHMVDNLISPKAKDKVVAIWDRTKFGLTREDYRKRTQCYKRLTRLWDDPDVARTHPDYDFGGRWSQVNTVLIDDTSAKARSEPFNLIEIPEFENKKDKYDLILLQVHDYINDLAFQSDVSAYMMAHPFRAADDPETPSRSMAAVYEPKKKRFAEARAKKVEQRQGDWCRKPAKELQQGEVFQNIPGERLESEK